MTPTMNRPTHVKCYGGPLHGQLIGIQDTRGGRFEVHDARFQKRPSPFDWDPDAPYIPEDYCFDTVTYQIERYREQRGNMRREMEIAILEGAELTHREHWQIDHDLRDYHWTPTHKPSFLYEFDRWIDLCCYKHTGDVRHLDSEFHLPPHKVA